MTNGPRWMGDIVCKTDLSVCNYCNYYESQTRMNETETTRLYSDVKDPDVMVERENGTMSTPRQSDIRNNLVKHDRAQVP